jgi:undecaprenyl diphosphate synthase
MDGNGRWARARGLPRTAGHRAGSNAVRRAVEACPDSGVTTLTLYAFSCDNWQRPASEVATLMRLFHRYLIQERQRAVRNGVRLSVIGRRDRLDRKLVKVVETTEALTARCAKLHLRIAVDYSARQAIEAAARLTPADETGGVDAFYRRLNETIHSAPSSSGRTSRRTTWPVRSRTSAAATADSGGSRSNRSPPDTSAGVAPLPIDTDGRRLYLWIG